MDAMGQTGRLAPAGEPEEHQTASSRRPIDREGAEIIWNDVGATISAPLSQTAIAGFAGLSQLREARLVPPLDQLVGDHARALPDRHSDGPAKHRTVDDLPDRSGGGQDRGDCLVSRTDRAADLNHCTAAVACCSVIPPVLGRNPLYDPAN
jgi:hypothetical protein